MLKIIQSYAMTTVQSSIVSAFINQYKTYLESKSGGRKETNALSVIKSSLSKSIEWINPGQPGLVSQYYGSFQGRRAVIGALKSFKEEVNTTSLDIQEIVDSSFDVDFTQANPLSPAATKVAVILQASATTTGQGNTRKGRDFRLDSVFYFDVDTDGRIKSVNTSFDTYIMSEALVGKGKSQVPNPDIDDVITGSRDTRISPDETLGASLRFFGAFAGVQSPSDLDILTGFVQPGVAVKFGGDPKILPFADKNIRIGKNALVQTFTDQLLDSAPKVFDIEEIYVSGDRFIANTFESRTAVKSGRNYDIPVSILFTASSDRGGRVASIEGIFDSSITTTAFTGRYPFPVST
jgi:hypothetical protein